MAKSWKRTEVTIENETRIVLSPGATSLYVWREGCQAASMMLTPLAAAQLAGISTRRIYARLEAGLVHFVETPDGTLLFRHSNPTSIGSKKGKVK